LECQPSKAEPLNAMEETLRDLSAPGAQHGAETGARPTQDVVQKGTFREFYQDNLPFVLRNAQRLLGSEHAADDIVQEVFMVALRRMDEFEKRSSAKTWLYGILRNLVMHHFRAIKGREPAQSVSELEKVASSSHEPDAAVEDRQARDLLYSLLTELDPPKRDVFILSELEQLSAPEIAEALGISRSTVHGRVRDGRRDFEAAIQRHRARTRREGP
jgi:RNA polymerase sigma-70 factor (ECF subfamily)